MLMFATKPSTIRVLIDMSHDIEGLAPIFDNVTPLHITAFTSKLEIIKTLLELGAKINANDFRGYNALYYALRARHSAAANLLIKKMALLETPVRK